MTPPNLIASLLLALAATAVIATATATATATAADGPAGPAGFADPGPKALFEQGNSAYLEGDFGRAIEAYSSIESTGRVSPPLLQNLAAAHRAACDDGAATWAERSAAALAGERWLFVEVAGVVALAGAVLWKVFGGDRVPRRGFRIAVGIALAATVAGVAGSAVSAYRFGGAIAVAPSPLLVSPFDGAEPTGSLGAGDPVAVERYHQGFALVLLPDGTHGWVPARSVRPVLPTRS
ncbi:hypothetical protein BH23VER1_BH23VER1_07560 [soil metagenome]